MTLEEIFKRSRAKTLKCTRCDSDFKLPELEVVDSLLEFYLCVNCTDWVANEVYK